MSERILSKALPSYTYEVTFGVGSLGINLQTTRSKKGAYVDTFFRPKENIILPAEQSGYIKLGDLLLEVNKEDVSQMSLKEIPRRIEQATRPITIKLERIVMELDFLDVVRDPRKLPWYMHFIVDKYDPEEASMEQAKLMLWLEVEQYVESALSVPDGDFTDHAHRILRKFFRPDSKFSLIVHVSNSVRSAMLTALALAEMEDMDGSDQGHGGDSDGASNSSNHQVYREAQKWAAGDLQGEGGSFTKFCSSRMCARMCGHLRNSPPFVKMTLPDVLRCDKKTIFLLTHLSPLRRHGVLHCYNLLKHRPEDDVEGGTGSIEDLLRVASACVHVLGLKEDSHAHGIEDLPMLTRLAALLPASIELSNYLSKSVSASWVASSRHATYLDRLQAAITTSIPPCDSLLLLARDPAKMAEVRDCLRALRTRIMRELCIEIMPKFLASSEFEILLWELDARRTYLAAEQEKRQQALKDLNDDSFDSSSGQQEEEELLEGRQDYDRDEVELVHTLLPKGGGGGGGLLTPLKSCASPSSTSPENPYLVVPDGAVQRLLRQTELPGSMTMHRAPLDMLEDMARELEDREGGPVSLLLAFDTEGGNIVDTRSLDKRRRSLSVSRDYPAHLKNVEDDDEGDEDDESDEDDVYGDKSATRGGRRGRDIEGALFEDTPEKKQASSTTQPEDVTVKYIHPIGSNLASTKFNKNYLSLIPDSINNFLIPHGQCIYDAPMPPKLFNFAVNMPNNSLVYGCCLLMYREVQVRIAAMKPKLSLPMTVPQSSIEINKRNAAEEVGEDYTPKTPSTGPASSRRSVAPPHHDSRQPQHPPPKTPVSSFKSLAAMQDSNSSPHVPPPSSQGGDKGSSLVTPLKSGGVGEFWSGVKESPFLGRFKGLALGTTPIATPNKPAGAGGGWASSSTSSQQNEPMGVRFADQGSIKHIRGGSDDISSSADGSSSLSSVQKKKTKNSTIQQVEHTYAQTKFLLEREGGGDTLPAGAVSALTPLRDRDQVSTPPPQQNDGAGRNLTSSVPNHATSKSSKVPVDNSILIAPTPSAKSSRRQGGEGSFQSYSSRLASSSDSSEGSRDEVLVPMYVANGFCLLTTVPCFNALRHPLSLLASDEVRLQGVLESTPLGGGGDYSDLETSEDDIEYEYSDDSDGALGMGGNRPRCLSDTFGAPALPTYEINAKTRSLRALNCMETDRSLVNLRQVFAEMNMNMKLPSVLRHGGAQDFNAEMILRALSPKNFVTIFIAFLLEFKIAVVSSKISALLAMGELLKVLIAPLKWSHVYCPLLPKKFSNDLLQCPTPFFVGVQREFMDLEEMPDDVIVLDLDQDSCSVTPELQGALSAGRKLTKTLVALLTPDLYCCDDLVPPRPVGERLAPSPSSSTSSSKSNTFSSFACNDMAAISSAAARERDADSVVREVLRACKLFVADILLGLQECCTFGIDHDEAVALFDEAMFIASKVSRYKHSDDSMLSFSKQQQEDSTSSSSEFLTQFLRTQCFSLCIIGTILKQLGPDSRPPSRPSSPFVSIPSPTLFIPPLPSSLLAATTDSVDPSHQMPTTPVQMS